MLRLFSFYLRKCGSVRQWRLLTLFALFNGAVELMTLGMLALFIASLTSLGDVFSSRYILVAKDIFGEYCFSSPKRFYLCLGSGIISLVLLKNTLIGLHYYATSRFEGNMNKTIGMKMLKDFMHTPYTWSASQNPAEVQSYVEWRLFVGFFSSQAMALIGEAVVSLFLFAAMFCFEPMVTLSVVSVAGVAGILFFCVFKSRISYYGDHVSDAQKESDRLSLMNIQGFRDIVTFNARGRFLRLFEKQLERFAWNTAWQRLFSRAPMLSLEAFGFLGVVGGSVLMVSFSEYTTARLMGTLSLIAVSAWRILPALNRAVVALGAMQSYRPYLEKVRVFMEAMESFQTPNKTVDSAKLGPLRNSIRLDGLTYTYDNGSRPALDGLTMSIPKGALVGVIGHSGAGKSTLTDILTGFLIPTQGAVLIDDVPLSEEVKHSWRDHVGLIPQRPYFFDGSIAENVAFTLQAEEVELGKVQECCRQAGADEFIQRLSEGVNARVGENGCLLSGGQAQRLAIARALYKNPPVLIFDEATSSLDERNASKIRETIVALKGERTVIIVAHRLRAVQDCDQLIWLKDGKIVEIGTPEVILPQYRKSAS